MTLVYIAAAVVYWLLFMIYNMVVNIKIINKIYSHVAENLEKVINPDLEAKA